MENFIVICLILYLYPFGIYPLLLYVLRIISSNKINKIYEIYPSLAILIPAYNEEKYIGRCLQAIADSDYPNDKLFVYVLSDGSSDATVAEASKFNQIIPNLIIKDFKHSGKNNMINYIKKEIREDLFFVIDADIICETDALKEIIANFADPKVGAVIGNLKNYNPQNIHDSSHFGETFYQRYESKIRINESQISSTVNGLGNYCIRSSVKSNIPNDRVCDDMYAQIYVITKNMRAIYDEKAVFYHIRPSNIKQEFHRHVRTMACSLETVFSLKQLLSPKYGFSAFFLWSHKIFRLHATIFLIFMNILMLVSFNNFSFYLAGLELIGIILGISGILLDKINRGNNILKIFSFILMMNFVFFAGFKKVYFRSKQVSQWSDNELKYRQNEQ
ncbi:MAG: glycosyltransferase [Candidatus Kapabacteria bacterium]|nr:glycosyltransferase [Candidatus Kapabacteria bacterium]